MKANLYVIIFLFFSGFTFAQQLTYEKGRIKNSDNQKLSNNEVKELLSANPEALALYKSGKTKAGIGGFLLGFGGGLVLADLLTGLTQDKEYPTTLTYVGLTSMAISVPVLIGHSKKIKSAVQKYNESLTNNKPTTFTIEKLNIISNAKGIGMQISF